MGVDSVGYFLKGDTGAIIQERRVWQKTGYTDGMNMDLQGTRIKNAKGNH